ncbi:MAG: 50S ribosomal protein L10 [Bacteroidota bacterium]|jgi:large subunit ribosomal protein L10|nr:50S ribosomal protein L10 [Sphingobacteriales bacterium]
MNKEQKGEIIQQLTQKLNEFKYIYVTDVSSLNAQKTSDLRRAFFKDGIEMEVAKNTLIEKAIERTDKNFGALVDTLKGNTALLFAQDSKSAAKIIKEFRKDGKKPELKGAYIDTDIYIGDNQLDSLIALKSKNELIGEIIGLLQSPAKNVISALQSSGGKLAGIVKTLSERPE